MIIFTSGAFLKPILVDDEFVWVVTSFEEDSYFDGKVFNPQESYSYEELIKGVSK